MNTDQPNPYESPQATAPPSAQHDSSDDSRRPKLVAKMWISGLAASAPNWAAAYCLVHQADVLAVLFTFVTLGLSLFALVAVIQVARLGRIRDVLGAACGLLFGVAPWLLGAVQILLYALVWPIVTGDPPERFP